MFYTYSGVLFSLKKEILTHATTWMNLDELSEISQAQKDNKNTVWFHL